MVAIAKTGAYFDKAFFLIPMADAAATFSVYNSAGSNVAASTVAFFTAWAASMGTTDTTNWTANTYKTIYNNASGNGRVCGYMGCTAGGAETHTLEITIDGAPPTEFALTLTANQRAFFSCYMPTTAAEWTTASDFEKPGATALNASKNGFSAITGGALLPWPAVILVGIPLIRYDRSLLIRAKHSVSITNSTATAYSAVQHLVGM